jgi:hypothetical protein
LKLECDEAPSKFAFNFTLRHYNMACIGWLKFWYSPAACGTVTARPNTLLKQVETSEAMTDIHRY